MNLFLKPFDNGFRFPEIFLLLLGSIFFFPLLGHVHLFDWDEINFAESAREMVVTGNYSRVMIDYVPFWEKPPLFFWLQALSMHVFGINELAARLPNAICGIVTLLILYRFGKQLKGHSFGLMWALLYLGSLLPHLYFKSGIIDPVFNLFIFLGIWFLIKTIEQAGNYQKWALLAGLFTGLAVLTKGPVGFLIVLLTFLVYWGFARFRKVASLSTVLIFAVTILLVSSVWFGLETLKHGPWFIVEFIQYQIRLFSTPDAGHQQPFFYHFVVVLIGCFPMSVLAIPYLVRRKRTGDVPDTTHWMRCLFWVVMILFTIVKTKIVHYSSMAYLPLSFLAASYIQGLIEDHKKPGLGVMVLNLMIGTVMGLLLIALPLLLHRKDWLIRLIDHPSLGVEVPMMGWEYLAGVAYLAMAFWIFYQMKKGSYQLAILVNTLVLGFTLLFYHYAVVPKVEAYSQRPAIEFYKSHAGDDVYIYPLFKTYAHYFYGRVKPENSTHGQSREWFLEGPIDKTVYFADYVGRMGQFEPYKDIQLLYTKGDFAFYVREPE